jgi:nicotinamide-nucleotide amidase
MKSEIISIGSELTSGQNLDTNSQWLSRRLAEMGIPVGWHTTIADDLADNVDAFRIAASRADLVLITGGLGPTQDDLTREALAKAAGVELVLDQESVTRIEQIFQRFGRPMPERNRVQAMFPAGAEAIANDRGTAPGIWMRMGKSIIAAMPGVPSELYAMFEKSVKPRLVQEGMAGAVLIERKINCFGAGESMVEQKLLDLTKRGQVPEVGITVSEATISLRIQANAATREEADALVAPVEKTIRERLGNLVVGADDEDLNDAVIALLKEKRRSLATAESVTAGQVAERLGRVPGASECFRGGVVAYDNRVKMSLLGVPQALLDEHGAVSAQVVEAMATGCRKLLQTDYAVSTVGLAGPGGATEDKPIGLVYAGLAWEGGVKSQSFSWTGTRLEIQSRATKMALNLIRLRLLEEEKKGDIREITQGLRCPLF